MSQTDSPSDTTSSASQTDSAAKPARNPIERLIVWGVIAVGLIFAGIEARAKFGYDMTFSSISNKLAEVDNATEADAELKMDDAIKLASFGPTISEIEEIPPPHLGVARVWHRKMTWFSLAKEYELTLVMDGEQTVLKIETPNPPAEEVDESLGPPAGGGGGHGDEGGVPPVIGPGGGGPGGGGGGPGGGGGQGGGGRGGGGPRGLTGLLAIREVGTELNLSEEQQSKVAEFLETIQAESSGMRDLFGQMRDAEEGEREQLREQINTMRAEIEAKTQEGLKEILNEEQMTRLQQINWQQIGTPALASADVAEKLGLSDEQQQKLTELAEARRDEMRELGFDGSAEERLAIVNSYNEQFLGVLTDEQKSGWTALLGETFTMPAPVLGGGEGGRGGGPGGRGGGGGGRPERPQRPE